MAMNDKSELIDELLDAVINFKQASLDFAAEAELFGDNESVLSTANVRLDLLKSEAKATLLELFIACKPELMEGTQHYPGESHYNAGFEVAKNKWESNLKQRMEGE